MKIKQVVNLKEWHPRPISVGHGTRDNSVMKQTKKGKVYFLAKTYDKDLGELRSEVCSSNLGRLFGFSVQKTWLCRIPQFKSLGMRHALGVLIQLDVRREKYTKRGQFREDLTHGLSLIAAVNEAFGHAEDMKKLRKIYTLQIVVDAIRNYVQKHPEATKLWEQFFELLVFDALIGGTDRHYNN